MLLIRARCCRHNRTFSKFQSGSDLVHTGSVAIRVRVQRSANTCVHILHVVQVQYTFMWIRYLKCVASSIFFLNVPCEWKMSCERYSSDALQIQDLFYMNKRTIYSDLYIFQSENLSQWNWSPVCGLSQCTVKCFEEKDHWMTKDGGRKKKKGKKPSRGGKRISREGNKDGWWRDRET